LQADVDYVVAEEEVQIVDQNTGRIFPDRTWRNGLHQMVEAKEGLTVSDENDPLARMSRQQYFQLYEGLCGMTGTATGSEQEFWHFYKLPVSVIPTRKECLRQELPTRFFRDGESKWRAIAAETARLQETGQPVLVGTNTIDASQVVAEELDKLGVEYQLLNGKQDEAEADIVSQAGQLGMVTIATNMAGRGTDIKLGEGVHALNGLHVIITEPNFSQRVDRQLLGRAARQGNPGSYQMFVSADDLAISIHAPWLSKHLRSSGNEIGEVRQDLAGEVAKLQRKVEQDGFDKRRQLFAHDTWLEDVMAKLAKRD
jgi:preprotein translocase subunit SecA